MEIKGEIEKGDLVKVIKSNNLGILNEVGKVISLHEDEVGKFARIRFKSMSTVYALYLDTLKKVFN